MSPSSYHFLLAIVLIGAAVPGGDARAFDASGFYIGGSFARAQNTWNTDFIDGQIAAEAVSDGDTLDFTRRSTADLSYAWWADAGYFFTPYIGIDAAFLHVGEIKYIAVGTITTPDGTTHPIASSTEVVSHGPALSLVLRAPLSESLAADLRLGDYFGKATQDNSITVDTNSSFSAVSKSNSSLLAGVGLSYTVGGHVSFRLDYLRINRSGDDQLVGKFSVNMAGAGMSYTF